MLEAKMAEHGDNYGKLATFLNISRQSCSSKVKGEREWKQSEISKIAMRYSLTAHDIVLIFLSEPVIA